jgi:hypothetical protein
MLKLKWTTTRTRVAARLIAYKRKLDVERPTGESDESEV